MLNIQQARQNATAGLRSFARSVGLNEDDAIAFYEEELQRLQHKAKITTYIDVIAEKHTRDQLRKNASFLP